MQETKEEGFKEISEMNEDDSVNNQGLNFLYESTSELEIDRRNKINEVCDLRNRIVDLWKVHQALERSIFDLQTEDLK